MVLLLRDGFAVLLWAVVALVLSRRLHDGEWAVLALLGSLCMLVSAGLLFVQWKMLFIDYDASLSLWLSDAHLSRLPTLLTVVGMALVAKAVLSGRPHRGRPSASSLRAGVAESD
jgi:hypothetical protein